MATSQLFKLCPFLQRHKGVGAEKLLPFSRLCPVISGAPHLTQSTANHGVNTSPAAAIAASAAAATTTAIAAAPAAGSTRGRRDLQHQQQLQQQHQQQQALPPDYYSLVAKLKLATLHEEGRYRVFANLKRCVGAHPKASLHDPEGNPIGDVTIWCSNDYLGMGQHLRVIAAAKEAVDASGVGSGGTRNISGSNVYHAALEKELADWHGKESALLFTSGYVANEATLSTLPALFPDLVFFSDSENHASMIAGMRNSRAEKRVFKHNDLQHLRLLLESADPQRPKLIAFESIYSMDGTVAPIKELCDLAQRFNCLTYLDEVHAVGMYGSRGSGVAEHTGQAHRINLINGTLAKAVGVFGGYVVGDRNLIDCIRSYAGGFIFTSSLPPAVTAAATSSVKHLKQSKSERYLQQLRVSELKSQLLMADLPVLFTATHIIPLLVGDAKKCKAASELLLKNHKIYIQPINYPTVPRGGERLRITPCPFHSAEDCAKLVSALNEVWEQLRLPRASHWEQRGVSLNRNGKDVQHLLFLLQKQQQFVKHLIQSSNPATAAAEAQSASSSSSSGGKVKACFEEETEKDWSKQQMQADIDWLSLLREGVGSAAAPKQEQLQQSLQQLMEQQRMCKQFFFPTHPLAPAAAATAEGERLPTLSQDSAFSGEHCLSPEAH